jgi:hypothetical protein
MTGQERPPQQEVEEVSPRSDGSLQLARAYAERDSVVVAFEPFRRPPQREQLAQFLENLRVIAEAPPNLVQVLAHQFQRRGLALEVALDFTPQRVGASLGANLLEQKAIGHRRLLVVAASIHH